VNKPTPERKVSVGDFAEKHRPEGKASKLLPFKQEIEELINLKYSQMQIREYLRENGVSISPAGLWKFLKKNAISTSPKKSSPRTSSREESHSERRPSDPSILNRLRRPEIDPTKYIED
jgi:transposase